MLEKIKAAIQSRGVMGGVISALSLLSLLGGPVIDPELVSALLENTAALVTIIGAIVANVVSIIGRVKAKGPIGE